MNFAFVTLLLVTDLKFSRKYLVVSIIICTFAPNKEQKQSMKKPLLLTIIICLSIVAYAGPVDLEQAKQNALRFMTDKHPAMARGKKIMTMTTACQTESYYVFNVGESQGYVIPAAMTVRPECWVMPTRVPLT